MPSSPNLNLIFASRPERSPTAAPTRSVTCSRVAISVTPLVASSSGSRLPIQIDPHSPVSHDGSIAVDRDGARMADRGPGPDVEGAAMPGALDDIAIDDA